MILPNTTQYHMDITHYHSNITQYNMDITWISPNITQYHMDISKFSYKYFTISTTITEYHQISPNITRILPNIT